MKNKFLALVLCGLFISSCGANNSSKESKESSEDGVTTVVLTKDNIDTYLNVSITGRLGYRENYSISFKGVLNFAIYENVVVTLNMNIYAEDNSPYTVGKNENFKRELILNAAGEGISTLYYDDGTIDHVVDTGVGYNNIVQYKCTWSIKDITGSVKYRL